MTNEAAEAEAREAWNALIAAGRRPFNGFDAFVSGFDAGRATEAARYRGLVRAARALDDFQTLADSGQSVFPLDPSHEDSMGNVYVRIIDGIRAALAENPAPAARSERDITKPPIIVGIDAEDEEWMNAPLGTPRPVPTDEAMVERVLGLPKHVFWSTAYVKVDDLRAVLAVIAEEQ